MTATPLHTDDVPEFTPAPKKSRKVITFKLEGHVLVARRPKTAWTLDQTRRWAPRMNEPTAQWDMLDEQLQQIFDAPSLAHLRARLDDEDDDFDTDDLTALGKWLQEQWSEGDPTGSSTGSSGRSRRTGVRSTARSRSGASTPGSSASRGS